jgi:hypothetical protein
MDSPVTVFRSSDPSADEDARNVRDMLAQEGIPVSIVDDSAPGVPSGVYEVRVDAENQARAEDLIARFSPDAELEEVDPSHALDLVTVFGEEGSASEMEAMQIRSILDAGGISSVVIGDSRYPIFGQQVRVAREHEARARQLIEEAQAAGPAGAESAEEDTKP